LLQNIILTGIYPDGTPINGCSYTSLTKANGEGDQKVTFYINNRGITAYLKSNIDIRGAQIEFGSVIDNPGNMLISTVIGEGYFKQVNNELRTLMYDKMGLKVIKSGENILADMPFNISNPEAITIEKIILIDVNRQRITNSEVEIIYGYPPSLLQDYILYQNYPNPFNPTTTIQFTIPVKSKVVIKVYDILGNEIAELVDEEKDRGVYSVTFNANSTVERLASGIYFYSMQAEGSTESGRTFRQTKKMVLIK